MRCLAALSPPGLNEAEHNSILKAMFVHDVTLASGDRALSLAVGFTAVAAQFDHTAPPVLDGGQ